MSLAYASRGGYGFAFWAVAGVVSLGLHGGLAAYTLRADAQSVPVQEQDYGLTGAIMFDLSDIIEASSQSTEDAAEVAQADDSPTVTESPEAVDPAKVSEEPVLNQTPYRVEDDELKFGIANPDSTEDFDKAADEIATEFEEEKVDQASATGSQAADASQASVAGIASDQQANTTTASDTGITAEQKRQVSAWQKKIVLKINANKSYPKLARSKRIKGEVLIRFSLDRYGKVISQSIEKSSGWPVLDNAALRVLKKVGKFPTPPSHLSGDEFTLMIPIRYRFR